MMLIKQGVKSSARNRAQIYTTRSTNLFIVYSKANRRRHLRKKRVYMNLFLSFLLTFAWNRIDAIQSYVSNYNEKEVWGYIDELQSRHEVSEECVDSLRQIIPLLTANVTLEQQREFFYESYGKGDSSQFVSRDLDRWFYKAMECLKVSGDTIYSASEYRTHYCYAKSTDTSYGICIPSTCEKDRSNVSLKSI
jgi:hypothetical protein